MLYKINRAEDEGLKEIGVIDVAPNRNTADIVVGMHGNSYADIAYLNQLFIFDDYHTVTFRTADDKIKFEAKLVGNPTMKIVRHVPEHTKTSVVLWVKHEFSEMNDRFRKIRPDIRSCFWCDMDFSNGDKMSLVHIEGKGNKLFCKNCVKLIVTE